MSEADLLRKCSTWAEAFSRTPKPLLKTRKRAGAEGAAAEELMPGPAILTP
ncbi:MULTISPECIES: hypothetical protein [Streptomyces]|uniref:hypothetical protein n=1 Tax=Streptomyces TaxID=1883 RepID=UPI000B29EBBE|nr:MULTISPECIES: hypothetical protein [Streptomyces]